MSAFALFGGVPLDRFGRPGKKNDKGKIEGLVLYGIRPICARDMIKP